MPESNIHEPMWASGPGLLDETRAGCWVSPSRLTQNHTIPGMFCLPGRTPFFNGVTNSPPNAGLRSEEEDLGYNNVVVHPTKIRIRAHNEMLVT